MSNVSTRNKLFLLAVIPAVHSIPPPLPITLKLPIESRFGYYNRYRISKFIRRRGIEKFNFCPVEARWKLILNGIPSSQIWSQVSLQRCAVRSARRYFFRNYYNRCRNIFYLLRQQCWRRLNFCAIKIQRSITETEFILKWILKRISWQIRSQVFHLATMRGSPLWNFELILDSIIITTRVIFFSFFISFHSTARIEENWIFYDKRVITEMLN